MIRARRSPILSRPVFVSETTAWFASGRTFPAGVYVVRYNGGALDVYGDGTRWAVNGSFTGYTVVTDAGTQTGPGARGEYATPAAAQAANAAAGAVVELLTPGRIGVRLSDPAPADNVPSPWGPPRFTLETVPSVAGVTLLAGFDDGNSVLLEFSSNVLEEKPINPASLIVTNGGKLDTAAAIWIGNQVIIPYAVTPEAPGGRLYVVRGLGVQFWTGDGAATLPAQVELLA